MIVKGTAKVGVSALPLMLGGGFIAFRLYVRKEVHKALMGEYDYAPLTMGNVFYSAVHGSIPLRKVTRKEMKRLARTLSTEFVPLMALGIPTTEGLRAEIKQRAVPSALNIVAGLF